MGPGEVSMSLQRRLHLGVAGEALSSDAHVLEKGIC